MRALLLILCTVWLGCSRIPASQELIEKSVQSVLHDKSIETIIAFAECQSPKGKYTTEVHSGPDEYTYFKQVYSYRDTPFEAVAIRYDSGFQVDSDSVFSLPSNAVSIIKGHEFHEILIEPARRFHDFKEPVSITEEGKIFYRVGALDNLNNPVELFFDAGTSELEMLTTRNPAEADEIIRLIYSNKKQIQGFALPMHVEIWQGEQKFIFDYTTVKINSNDFKRWSRD